MNRNIRAGTGNALHWAIDRDVSFTFPSHGSNSGAHREPKVSSGLPRVYTRRQPRSYVCILYGSQSAPLLLPWLGEVQGTSLAMTHGKKLPVIAHIPMLRMPTVLPATGAVGGAADGRRNADWGAAGR